MIHLYSAESAGPLSERLAGVLSEVPGDPMTPEWLAVPSDGMRRWLTLELARHLGSSGPDCSDGVAANIARALPGDLRKAVLAVGRARGETDPWRIDRLVWSVLEVLVEDTYQPDLWAAPTPAGGPVVYATARRIADLFDRYHLHRPEMVRRWQQGHDVDATGKPLSDHARWQAGLWRQVRERVGEPSPPERLPGVLERLRDGEPLLDLPPRLLFFGFTLLPAGDFLEVTRAVAVHREVHVFLLEPTRFDAAALRRSSPPPVAVGARVRVNESTASLAHHPLLRSWGRLHRETALLLADAQADGVAIERVGDRSPHPPSTLLGRVQHDICSNAVPVATLTDDPSDRSVQFHACFGEVRQVEVLRDALLHLMATPGSDLTEDDIVVLCPALDRFAPLIEAVFGRSAEASSVGTGGWFASGGRPAAPMLRYRVADRSVRTRNPVLAAVSALLELVAGRFDVTSVLEFLSLAPVRERFGFDDDSLGVIAGWMEATNVRWGLDAGQRSEFGMPSTVVSNTWQAALDRLLVGSAVRDEGLELAIGGIAPHGVEGSDVETAGRLAEAIGQLAALAGETSTAQPIGSWLQQLHRTCSALFAAPREAAWQTEAMERILFELADSADRGGAPCAVDLRFAEVRKVLEERLDDRVGRADFFRGGITVTSMTPLRWVPFRVVCLLGMDQTAFGSEGSPGDDLTSIPPFVGDGDRRGEMRQTLLEAVLAAQDQLIVIRDGRDVKTNQVTPRAVVTSELFESVLASVEPGARRAVADRLEIDHPRHGFDERCFEAGRLVDGTAWGFDPGELAGAVARRHQADRRPPFLTAPLPPVAAEVIDLADLHRFFNDPSGAFLSQRLQLRLPRVEDEIPTVLPLGIGGLEGWRIGNRLLEARVSGHSFDEWLRHERALGTLPPGPLGDGSVHELEIAVDGLVDEARRRGMEPGPGEPMAVDAVLPDGIRVVGSVHLRLDPASPGPVRLYYSRAKAGHRVAAWLDLMALLATDPATPWRSVAVSRPESGKSALMVTDLVGVGPHQGRKPDRS